MTSQVLPSERVVVESPMSFTGSARRIWPLTRVSDSPWAKVALYPTAATLVALAWAVVVCWYVLFSLLLVPYRLVRRSHRKRRRDELRHREQLEAARRG